MYILGCEKTTKPDTTPPTITITNPQNGDTVFEIVTISCMSTDNEGVKKVELWIDGVFSGISDNTEPYSLMWNTTIYEDNTSHTIIVRSYDLNDNTTDSEGVTLIVDNSGSYPQPINIISILFEDGHFTIIWNQSTDKDFSNYELEKSLESTMSEYDIIYNAGNFNDTTYVDNNINPLIYQYYRISVSDTIGYKTKGQVFSSSLDPVPTPINIITITYNLEEMTIEWEESSDNDFNSYKLLHSDSESGDKDTLVTYTDITTTNYILTEFDPTHENWFWVLVSDTLGQNSIGEGYLVLESPPTLSELHQIIYENDSFIISWSQNSDDDFMSYELYESLSEDMSNQTKIFNTNVITDTSYVVKNIGNNEIRYYQLYVSDIWGLQSSSNIHEGSTYIKFVNTIGGGSPDYGECVEQTPDGGYIIAGSTESFGNGERDVWVIKTNEYGNEEWNHSYGGNDYDLCNSLDKTIDNGFILLGSTKSYGNGDTNIWLIKINSNGNEEWNKIFETSGCDNGYSVKQVADNGFIITGTIESIGRASTDISLIKTDSQGNMEWNKTFGGSDFDYGFSVDQTNDEGYIIAGSTESFGYGDYDVWLIKTDSQGNEEWNKTFGGIDTDESNYVFQTFDGGYILTGNTRSYGNGSYDVWLIKTDSQGNEEWNKTFGGISSDYGYSVYQTNDEGFIITGLTSSFGNGGSDVWLIKTDSQGNEEWNRTFGENTHDYGRDVKQATDGGYIITGYTNSFNALNLDVLIIKTDPNGNVE